MMEASENVSGMMSHTENSGPVHFDVHIPESRRNFHHKDRVVRLTALDEAFVVARCDSIIRLSVLKS